MGSILFADNTAAPPQEDVELTDETLRRAPAASAPGDRFPPAMIKGMREETKERIRRHIDDWMFKLKNEMAQRESQWADWEMAYRSQHEPAKKLPFAGANNDVIPAIAMAVDPIMSRLDTGIFKQDPVFSLTALRKSYLPFIPALQQWVDFNQRHMWRLRQVAQPQLLEFTKLGTTVFKTVYERDEVDIKTYDGSFNVVRRREVRYAGPKVVGISLSDLLFSPNYRSIQDCPFVAERQRVSFASLKRAENQRKLVDVDKVKGREVTDRSILDDARQEAALQWEDRSTFDLDNLEVWECWFDFDIDDNGTYERLVATYHLESKTLLSLRFNWYFNQRKPYTVIPYTVTNGSLYGIGLCEMCLPFQIAITKWHQMAQDNAYIANIRMFVVRKGSGIEEVPRLYAGRCFFVDNPSTDFQPFRAGEIYPSTLNERQNLFGLMEKRTGVSDYLTGRESPIIGSRATATSTVALIQEGTKRVEEVLENLRAGFSEILENAFSIWVQYGPEGLDELVFGDDQLVAQLRQFFSTVNQRNVNGALAVNLTATDASGARAVMQQTQLSLIQVIMQYLEKLLQAGQGALQALQAGQPEYAHMVQDVMHAARQSFLDLLNKYDIKNADDYLPQLENYLGQLTGRSAASPSGGQPGSTGLAGGPPGTGALARMGLPGGAAQEATASGAEGPPGSGGLAELMALAGRAPRATGVPTPAF